jgi:hypothetical protein
MLLTPEQPSNCSRAEGISRDVTALTHWDVVLVRRPLACCLRASRCATHVGGSAAWLARLRRRSLAPHPRDGRFGGASRHGVLQRRRAVTARQRVARHGTPVLGGAPVRPREWPGRRVAAGRQGCGGLGVWGCGGVGVSREQRSSGFRKQMRIRDFRAKSGDKSALFALIIEP